jgi:hypothetical protein
MKAIRTMSICALTVFGFTTGAHAEAYMYRLTQYPASAGDCHAVADELGMRFAQLAGVTPTRSFCADIGPHGYDIQIEYAAAAPLPVVETIDPTSGPDGQGGVFDTLEQCQGQLATERERFETATGLTAFVAYCKEDAFADRPFAIYVASFGSPTARPRLGQTYVFGEPVDMSPTELETEVLAGLQRRGVDVSYVKYKPIVGYGTVVFLYYSDAALPVSEGHPVHLLSAGDCESALAALRPVYGAASPAPLAMFCSHQDIYDTYDVALITAGAEPLRATASAERFPSQAACESGRDALVARYRNELGEPVVGSACSYDDTVQVWRVALIEGR